MIHRRDAARPRLDDPVRATRIAARAEERADALYARALDCRRWGLEREERDGLAASRKARVDALMAHGEAAALGARLAEEGPGSAR